MLRIIQTSSVAAAKSYYTQGLAREDYYAEGQECVGRWGGRAAALMGLEGDVDPDAFAALCDNQHPQTGRRLTPRTKVDRTVGYDFNFHAPKSVSVVYELTRDEGIVEDFRLSVDETMREMEADTRTRVRKGGENSERVTGNLAWGEFVHFTARPVNGVPDPHLHAHCFVFNATYDQEEEKWKAGQFREIKRDAPYFEAAFHARFAERLAHRGYGIDRTEHGWELTGVPSSVVSKFSRRTQLIEAEAEKRGLTTDEQKDNLGAKTREAKTTSLTRTELRHEWRGRLSIAEEQSVQEAQYQEGRGNTVNVSNRDALQHAAQHHFERASVVSERELLRTALRYGVGSVNVEAVHRDAEKSALIRRERDDRMLVTHKKVLQEEQELLAYARDGRGTRRPLVAEEMVIRREELSAEQQAAVRHVWNSADSVIAIRGAAGVGKTTLMQEAVQGIESTGVKVFTFAPSSEASRGVLRTEGFGDADTVARLLQDKELQQAVRGQVIWIDEAGQMGTRTVHQVFMLAKEADARVVLSGDSRQHAGVERGDSLRLLEEHAGIVPAEVTQIRRQQGAYKEAVTALSEGRAAEGFDRLDQLGFVQELPEEVRYAQLAADYSAAKKAGKSVLVVAPTHAEGEHVTAVLREELRSTGRLTGREEQVERLKNRSLTEAERQDPLSYREGDVVQFIQNAKGARRGERLPVAAIEDGEVWLDRQGERVQLPRASAKSFQVYTAEELQLSKGDTIRITQNGQTQDTKHRLNNGALYEIESFTKKGDVKLSNGWVVGRDFGHWTHGYATTSHASQGKTVDQVFVAQSSTSLPASSLEQFYVSVSRARQNVTIYTDDKEALREAVQESSRRLSATELVSDVKPAMVPPRERTQEQLDQVRNYKRHLEYQSAEVTIPTRDYTNSISAKFGRPTADREMTRE